MAKQNKLPDVQDPLWQEFSAFVANHRLSARWCGVNHWQIWGGSHVVNYYARTKRGARMYVEGAKVGCPADLERATMAAVGVLKVPMRIKPAKSGNTASQNVVKAERAADAVRHRQPVNVDRSTEHYFDANYWKSRQPTLRGVPDGEPVGGVVARSGERPIDNTGIRIDSQGASISGIRYETCESGIDVARTAGPQPIEDETAFDPAGRPVQQTPPKRPDPPEISRIMEGRTRPEPTDADKKQRALNAVQNSLYAASETHAADVLKPQKSYFRQFAICLSLLNMIELGIIVWLVHLALKR